jgi:O-succinylbenzoate synthase
LWCRTQDVSDAFANEVDAAVAWVMRDRHER